MIEICEILLKPCFLEYCKNILGKRREWKANELLSEVQYYILKNEKYHELSEKEIKAIFLKVAKTEAHKQKSEFNKRHNYNSFDSAFVERLTLEKYSDCSFVLNGSVKVNSNEDTNEQIKELFELNRDRVEEELKEKETDSDELFFFKNIARIYYEGQNIHRISINTGINCQSIKKSIIKFIEHVQYYNHISINSEDPSL